MTDSELNELIAFYRNSDNKDHVKLVSYCELLKEAVEHWYWSCCEETYNDGKKLEDENGKQNI